MHLNAFKKENQNDKKDAFSVVAGSKTKTKNSGLR